MCGFYEDSSSSMLPQSVTLGNKVIRRKGKDRKGVAFYYTLCLSWCWLCAVCARLLMYDDKDLQGFGLLKSSSHGIVLVVFNTVLSRGGEMRGSKMSWPGYDQKERPGMHLVL